MYRVTFEDENHIPIKEVTLAADSWSDALSQLIGLNVWPSGTRYLTVEEIPPDVLAVLRERQQELTP